MPTLTLHHDHQICYDQICYDQIYYERIDGKAGRPQIVFLHEGLGCTAMWKDFPQRLCTRTGCPGLVYDRLGYGKSSPLSRPRTIHYLHHYALFELPRVLDALIPGEPFVLAGHSDGASIALIFGSEQPSSLKGIITEAAHVFVEKETTDGIIETVESYEGGKLSGLFKYHGEKTEDIFRAWSDTWLSEWFRHWNIEYLLPSIGVPVHVVQGCRDQYGTEAQVNSIVSGVRGKATASMVKDCGHSPHQEHPSLLLEIMSRVIDPIL